jgi:hypothetical protein
MTRSTVLILQYDLPNGLLASQNFTNSFGYTKYLTEPEPGQLLIPINLVFQMSDFRYKIKLRYLLSDWNIDLKNPGGPSQWTRTQTDPGSRLVDPVDDEEDRPQTDPPTWQCDLNKWKNINTHPIDWSSLYLLYIGLAIEF